MVSLRVPVMLVSGTLVLVLGAGTSWALPAAPDGAAPAEAAPHAEGSGIEEVRLVPDAEVAAEIQADVAAGTDPLEPSVPLGEGAEPSPGAAPRTTFEAEGVVLSGSGSGSGLATVGVTWSGGTAPAGTEVGVRTRSGSEWSEWVPVELDLSAVVDEDLTGTDAGDASRDGTEPLFVGVVDEVQAVVRGTGSTVPSDVRLVIVDPGVLDTDAHPSAREAEEFVGEATARAQALGTRDTVDLSDVTLTSSVVTAPGGAGADVENGLALAAPGGGSLPAAVTTSAAAAPLIYSRAQWGADESIMRWTPEIGTVRGAVIHHTAGTNDYTAAQVPSILRGIYSYHSISRGWGDIGYNFLVDKFGRVWEGRSGGIDRATIGAHASGVNSQMFGISVMGNYEQAAFPQVAMDSVERLAAWKLGLHGVSANGRSLVNGVDRPAIVGHRDVGQTACPGRNIYGRLATIRAQARALQGTAAERGPRRDLSGDGRPDLALLTAKTVSMVKASASGWGKSAVVGSGWVGSRTIAPGDWTRDGNPDLMLLDSSNRLWLYPGTTSGGWGARQLVSVGWGGMNLVVGGHDWNGDGRPDLLARRGSDGSLWLFPSTAGGKIGAAQRIGVGWGTFASISMVGDLADGSPALVARAADGVMYTYKGNGKGGFKGSPLVVGSGWASMTTVVGPGDVTGDGHGDLVARDAAGALWLYPGTGAGKYAGRTKIGTGWQSFSVVLPAGRKGPGQDFYAISTAGALLRYPYKGLGGLDQVVSTGIASSSTTAEVIAPGDWNGDGLPDLMVRRTDGALMVHLGTSTGKFATTGSRVGSGWQIMSQVVGAGDWLGTGVPGLIALERGAGRIWLYPGDGKGGFGQRILLASGVGTTDRIVNAGRWTGGTAPDLITREAGTGRLFVRKGNGGARLMDPRPIGQGWGGMSSIIGVGDLDGDARADLVAARSNGELVLYPGDGAGGFLSARVVGKATGVTS